MTPQQIMDTVWFKLSYWMFIGGVSIAFTGFVIGMIVVIRGETL